jgi:hypothetical protein
VSGVLEGGWEFVRAAYLLTAAVFFGYAVSVHRRYRAERSRRARRAAAPDSR